MVEPAIKRKTAADLFTVAEYLEWAEEVGGRYELHAGQLVATAPERNLHNLTKGEIFSALRDAVRSAGLDCTVFSDGVTVKTDEDTAYEPDVTVQCGIAVDLTKMTADAPVIVVEVLSPSSIGVDTGAKLSGYLALPSLRHVLIVDPDRRIVTHHRPDAPPEILAEGVLRLDPPGLEVPVEALFIPALKNTDQGD